MGISEHEDDCWYSYQLIYNDGDRTEANDTECVPEWWRDFLIDNDAEIRKVEVMYRKFDSLVFGFKFIDADGNTLVSTELIDNQEYRKN